MRNCGAGYFQIINVETCPHDGYYVTRDECKDGLWEGGIQCAKSDVQFRRRINKKVPMHKLPEEFRKMQIHMNHERDNEVGYHLETIR